MVLIILLLSGLVIYLIGFVIAYGLSKGINYNEYFLFYEQLSVERRSTEDRSPNVQMTESDRKISPKDKEYTWRWRNELEVIIVACFSWLTVLLVWLDLRSGIPGIEFRLFIPRS